MTEDQIDRYGVMGYPVSHSKSPIIHKLFAQQTNQDMQYELLQVKPDNLESAIRQFGRTGGRGLNLTVPHKSEVVRLIDEMSPRASNAGAVNTLVYCEDGLFGDNTDGIGLLRDLKSNHKLDLKGTNILILGAGGATRGIVAPLIETEPQSIVIANRSLSRAKALADHFSTEGPVSACRFENVTEKPVYDLIINATSAGLKGQTPPYPEAAVHSTTVCYDLSYGLKPTPFANWAAEQGAAKSVMGWGMLVEQAAESFKIWRGVRPDTAEVLRQLAISAS